MTKTRTINLGNKTTFEYQADTGSIRLSSLFGMPCDFNGGEDLLEANQGLFILRTDKGRFEGGSFKLDSCDTDDGTVTLGFRCEQASVRLRTRFEYHADSGIIGRRDTIENTGSENAKILRALPRFCFHTGEYDVYAQRSHWQLENQGKWLPLHCGTMRFSAHDGRHTNGGTPYICLRNSKSNCGVAFHVVPHGNWMIRVSGNVRSDNRQLCAVVELGLSDEDLCFELPPGGKLELPEILAQELPRGEIEAAAPALQTYLKTKLPRDPKPYMPVLYNSWFYNFDNFSLSEMREQLKAAVQIGCEVFVVDAGWYGTGDNWYDNVGDWRENSQRGFHGNMSAFADEVRAAGLEFGLWIEPERFGADVPVVQEHPEWFLPGVYGFKSINFSHKGARDYQYDTISGLIEKYGLKYIKTDCNSAQGHDASGRELYDYFSEWYGILDRLRKNYPDVVIENCASGALRLDPGTLQHFDVHFSSDNVYPPQVLRILQGTYLRMLPGKLINWTVVAPSGAAVSAGLRDSRYEVITPVGATWERFENIHIDSVMVYAMMGMMGFSGDLAGLSPPILERMKKHVELYKSHREMICRSIVHLLTPVRPVQDLSGWAGFQFYDADSTASLVFVYHYRGDLETTRHFKLMSLEPGTVYSIERIDAEDGVKTEQKGDVLMEQGLRTVIESRSAGGIETALYTVRRKTK